MGGCPECLISSNDIMRAGRQSGVERAETTFTSAQVLAGTQIVRACRQSLRRIVRFFIRSDPNFLCSLQKFPTVH